jgi:hypothetical protein
MRGMQRGWIAVLWALSLAPGREAWADDKERCLEASEKAQTFRDAHQLVEALEQLRICASERCPRVVQSDCGTWLDEVERSVATVVLTAKDDAGVDLLDVTVSLDGAPLVSRLDGQAVPVNAGPHVFHFERGDGTSAERQVLVAEGGKNQSVAAVLAAKAPPIQSPVEAPVAEPQPKAPAAPEEFVSSASRASSGWTTRKKVAAAVGAVGLTSLAAGTAFGLAASGTWSQAKSDCANGCGPGDVAYSERSDARTFATLSTVGFVLGATGVVVAGILWLTGSPDARRTSSIPTRVGPLFLVGKGACSLGGVF